MIVKFFRRGSGSGRGVVEYLLGRDFQRDGASVISGDPRLTEALIDSSKYAHKYTSGALSFEAAELDPLIEMQLMAEFEQVLMAGLHGDQYKVLWVRHVDKGRVELNFVIPNLELHSGKRLQPYYDPVDRQRVNAWAVLVRDQHDLADPNLPSRKRPLALSRDLPRDRVKAAEQITEALVGLVAAGDIHDRDDVLKTLAAYGFQVTRATKTSITIATDGGKPLRLKGTIYERDFKSDCFTPAAESAADRSYFEDRERRLAEAQRVLEEGIRRKREYHRARFPRVRTADESLTAAVEDYFRDHVFDDSPGLTPDLEWRDLVAGSDDQASHDRDRAARGFEARATDARSEAGTAAGRDVYRDTTEPERRDGLHVQRWHGDQAEQDEVEQDDDLDLSM